MGGIGGIGRVISRFVKQFIGEERANIAMIFALSFVTLVGAVGGGIDLSRALVTKSRLASAACPATSTSSSAKMAITGGASLAASKWKAGIDVPE